MNAPNPLVQFKRELEAVSVEMPTSNTIPIEKMKSAIVVAVQRNPDLLSADRSTLWQSARQCAADGLLPDGREAAFVIFNTKLANGSYGKAVQYIPMVGGLRKRAKNSGEVSDIREYLVYEGEWNNGRFEMIAGDEEKIVHRPIIDGAPGEPERGEIIGGYAVAILNDGAIIRHWMSVADIEKRRRASPSQKVYEKGKQPRVSEEPLGVWKEWKEEQYRKTLVRGISKKLSLSSDDMRAIMESDRDFEPAQRQTVDQVRAPDMADRLKAAQAPEIEDAQPVAEYDDAEVFPGDPAMTEGAEAFKAGLEETDCPHSDNPAMSCWIYGYRNARKAAE